MQNALIFLVRRSPIIYLLAFLLRFILQMGARRLQQPAIAGRRSRLRAHSSCPRAESCRASAGSIRRPSSVLVVLEIACHVRSAVGCLVAGHGAAVPVLLLSSRCCA